MAQRVGIPEVGVGVPYRYRHNITVDNLPVVVVEKGEDVLRVIHVSDLTTFTYNFDSITETPDPEPATRLRDILSQVQQLTSEVAQLRTDNTRLQTELDNLKGRVP